MESSENIPIVQPEPALHPRQQALLDAIVEYKRRHDGNSPATEQLMAATGITGKSMVHYHLVRLALAGLITIGPGTRSIEVRGGHWSLSPNRRPT